MLYQDSVCVILARTEAPFIRLCRACPDADIIGVDRREITVNRLARIHGEHDVIAARLTAVIDKLLWDARVRILEVRRTEGMQDLMGIGRRRRIKYVYDAYLQVEVFDILCRA